MRQLRHKENSMISYRHLEAKQELYSRALNPLADRFSFTNHTVSEADSSHPTGDYTYSPSHPFLCGCQKPLLLNSVKLLIQARVINRDIIPDSPFSNMRFLTWIIYLVLGVINLLKFYAEVCA